MCALDPYSQHQLPHHHKTETRHRHHHQHRHGHGQLAAEQQAPGTRKSATGRGAGRRTAASNLQIWYILHVILVLIDISSSLTMTEVTIPNHIMRLKSATLGCRYALNGESLYSVKWYKDGHEIYRYVPRDKPPGQAFPLPGVNIDLRNSSDTQILLRRVTLQSSGLYRCEVSGEAPAFNTVAESETMTVVESSGYQYVRGSTGEIPWGQDRESTTEPLKHQGRATNIINSCRGPGARNLH
ncbi:uncharacterized protein [Drosophila bipectinata]|uniref:uncharacterized protein n=1 Tax=Drosophila bipectinata TaxID=42026 RepID=UPI0038B2E404